MSLLEVQVELVGGVTPAVVLQGHDLPGRVGLADFAVVTVPVLVDVVAEVHHHVDVLTLSDLPVGVEVAMQERGAGTEGEAPLVREAVGGSLRPTDDRGPAQALEPVVIGRTGLEAGGLHLDGEVPVATGRKESRSEHGAEVGAGGELPVDLDVPGGLGGHSGPENDGVGQRVSTGDTVAEQSLRSGITGVLVRHGLRRTVLERRPEFVNRAVVVIPFAGAAGGRRRKGE